MQPTSSAGSKPLRGGLLTIAVILSAVGVARMNVDREPNCGMPQMAEISTLMIALGLYKLDTGTYPPSEAGLISLRVNRENRLNWAGPYLAAELPIDPWGRAFLYKYPGDHGDLPDLKSLGPDGIESGDDVVSWQ